MQKGGYYGTDIGFGLTAQEGITGKNRLPFTVQPAKGEERITRKALRRLLWNYPDRRQRKSQQRRQGIALSSGRIRWLLRVRKSWASRRTRRMQSRCSEALPMTAIRSIRVSRLSARCASPKRHLSGKNRRIPLSDFRCGGGCLYCKRRPDG